MKTFATIATASFAFASLMACQPVRPPPDLIGTLEVDGPSGYLDGRLAKTGDRVYHGNTISTGSQTSVRLRFVEGGYLQLDENTDPQLLREGACILIRILTGQAFVDAKRVCITDPNIEVVLNSRVTLRVSGRQSVLTVLQGSAEVTRPTRATLDQYYQYAVDSGRVVRTVRLTREEAEAAAQWTNRYFQRPRGGWCCARGEVFPSDVNQCGQQRGQFFTDQRAAQSACPPSSGWCCASGKFFPADANQCAQQRGQFFTDQRAAQSACPPSSGWCCAGGKVFPSDVNQCGQQRGQFFTDQRAAASACSPRLGWCCTDGKVVQLNQEQCMLRGGSFSFNRDDVWDKIEQRCAPKPPAVRTPIPGGRVPR